MKFFDKTSLIVMFGLAAFWAWMDSVFFSVTLFSTEVSTSLSLHQTLLLSLVIGSGVAAILMFRPSIIQKASENTPIIIALALSGMLGVILGVISTQSGSVASAVVSTFLSSIPMVFFPIIWGVLCVEDEQNRGATWIIGSVFLGTVLHLIISGVQEWLSVLLVGLLIPVTAILYLFFFQTRKDIPKRYNYKHKVKVIAVTEKGRTLSIFGFPWRLVFGLLVFSFAFGAVKFMYDSSPPSGLMVLGKLDIIGRSLVALSVFASVAIFSWNAQAIYRTGFLLMIAGFLVVPFFFDYPFLISLAVCAGYACFELMVWVVVFEAIRHKALNSIRSIIFVRLLTMGGILIGALIGGFFGQQLSTGVQELAIYSTAAAYLLVTTTVLVLNENSTTGFWSLLQKKEEGKPVVSLENKCETVVEQYGLTKREHEILLLLATGRSAPYIAQELTISEATVRFHIRNVYNKLGVHDKQSFLDAIEIV